MAELGSLADDGTSATGGSARSEVSGIQDRRWRPRRGLAFAVSALTFIIPFTAAILAVELVTRVVGRPQTLLPFLLWLAVLLVVSTAVMRVVDHHARRLLPLATLLRLSLVFPDQAPSRFSLALKQGTGRSLERAVAETTAEEQFGTPQEAAVRVVSLIAAVGRHDRQTRGHCERVRAYSDLIGQQLGLDEDSAAKLHWAALLHDVGKLDVSPAILNKKGKLTPEEWEQVREHPAHSDRWIAGLAPWLGEWVLAASQHHERFDGAGYPYGLAGNKISLAGRIVSVADAFDVMTAARSYKKPFPAAQARVELTDNAGTQFDPQVVRAFLAISVGELRRTMGPVAWLATVPEVLRAAATGALVPARTAVVAAGVTVAGLVPAIAAPVPVQITPAAVAATDTASALAQPGHDDTSSEGSRAARPTSATNEAPAGATGDAGAAPPAPGVPIVAARTAEPDGSGSGSGGGGSSNSGPGGGGGDSSSGPGATTTTTAPPTTTPNTAPPSPRPPVARNDNGSAILNTLLIVDVLANDSDPDGNLAPSTLRITARSAAAGSHSITVVNGRIEFLATALLFGPTWFDYEVCDTTGLCASARVSLSIAAA